jgi:hypothetical protein
MSKAQGEEVWTVPWRGEDVAGYLEMSITNLDKDLGFEELLKIAVRNLASYI